MALQDEDEEHDTQFEPADAKDSREQESESKVIKQKRKQGGDSMNKFESSVPTKQIQMIGSCDINLTSTQLSYSFDTPTLSNMLELFKHHQYDRL